jgi:hypothetical protein
VLYTERKKEMIGKTPYEMEGTVYVHSEEVRLRLFYEKGLCFILCLGFSKRHASNKSYNNLQ